MSLEADWSNRLENTARVVLRSHGALFFANGSVSGLLFLLAITTISPFAGALAVAGALAASLTAKFLGGERLLIDHGIYGYNGVLAGLATLFYVRPETAIPDPVAEHGWRLLFAIVAAALTGILMRLWFKVRLHERPGLPALSFPSIVAVWATGFVAVKTGLLALSADALFPAFIDARWHGLEGVRGAYSVWYERGLPYLPVVIVFGLGYAAETPRRALLVVGAMILSLGVGGAFLGPNAAFYPSYTFYTAPPLALALGWFFLAPGLKSLLTTLVAMALAVPVWHQTGLIAERFELPLLTLPFALTAFAMLAIVRYAPRPLAALLPERVPLHRVGATAGTNLGPSRAAGLRYWSNMEELARLEREGKPSRALRQALAHLTSAKRAVVLSGAGLSTESGIPDYRTGIIAWTVYDPAELTYERFLADPRARATYWRMSQDFYVLLREAVPNRGHLALAKLEQLGKVSGIITQNVDRLHQRAGSTRVVEIHGNEFGVTCLNCGAKYSRDEIYRWILHGTEVPYCLHCQGFLKPDSVAFGQPMIYESSRQALELVDRCDLLIVAGTSLTVDPVAALVARAAKRGVRLVIVNWGPTDFDAQADVLLRGSAGAILERLVDDYVAQQAWVK